MFKYVTYFQTLRGISKHERSLSKYVREGIEMGMFIRIPISSCPREQVSISRFSNTLEHNFVETNLDR
jgi:hypothetical protein